MPRKPFRNMRWWRGIKMWRAWRKAARTILAGQAWWYNECKTCKTASNHATSSRGTSYQRWNRPLKKWAQKPGRRRPVRRKNPRLFDHKPLQTIHVEGNIKPVYNRTVRSNIKFNSVHGIKGKVKTLLTIDAGNPEHIIHIPCTGYFPVPKKGCSRKTKTFTQHDIVQPSFFFTTKYDARSNFWQDASYGQSLHSEACIPYTTQTHEHASSKRQDKVKDQETIWSRTLRIDAATKICVAPSAPEDRHSVFSRSGNNPTGQLHSHVDSDRRTNGFIKLASICGESNHRRLVFTTATTSKRPTSMRTSGWHAAVHDLANILQTPHLVTHDKRPDQRFKRFVNKPPSPAAWPTSKGHNFPHAGVACSLTSMQPIVETFCFEGTVSVWEHTAVPTEANELFHAVSEQAMQNRQAPFVRNLHAKARHMPCFSHQSKMPEQVLIQPHRKEPHILLGFVIWGNSLVWARTHVRSVRLVLHQRSKLATTFLNVHGAGIKHTDATRSSRSNIRDTKAKFAATRRHAPFNSTRRIRRRQPNRHIPHFFNSTQAIKHTKRKSGISPFALQLFAHLRGIELVTKFWRGSDNETDTRHGPNTLMVAPTQEAICYCRPYRLLDSWQQASWRDFAREAWHRGGNALERNTSLIRLVACAFLPLPWTKPMAGTKAAGP